jgi:ATP/maltotriose-dependent transcriptional regulator MalT
MHLLERESLVGALSAALDEVAHGSGGRIALVCGEAGIGKTSLIREFADRQRAATRVLWGSCEALLTPHPLAPLYDIARQAGDEFREAIAQTRQREVIFNTTVDHLARGDGPVIVIFEDVHWADDATLDLIKFLGRRLQRLPVLLVFSYRDDEVGPGHPLRSVLADLPVRRLLLPPLSEAAVAALAYEAGRPSAQLHTVTGGNPFFVTEALAMSEGRVPATVCDAVIGRIARLSEAARDIANLVSVVPGKAEKWLLEKTVGVRPAALEECLQAGMIAHANGSLAFRHELARRAVEESLPPPLGQALHARVLGVLRTHDGEAIPVARLVHHADKAADGAAVLRFAPEAAEIAISLHAHREAASHFSIALSHANALAGERMAELLGRAAYEWYLTDRLPEAIAASEKALALWRAAGRAREEGDTLRWLSRFTWFSGNKAAADAYAEAAIRTLESLSPGRELAMAFSNRSQLLMLAHECEAALPWGDKAIALARELGDTTIESHALNNVGTAKLAQRDLSGRDDLERSLSLALSAGLQEHAARAFINLGNSARRWRDFARAEKYLADGIAYSKEHDIGAWESYLHVMLAEVHLEQGHWQRALDAAEAVLRSHKVAAVTRIPALIVIGRVRARRGNTDARQPLAEAHSLALTSGEMQRIGPAVMARAELAWLSGEPVLALEELGSCYEIARKQSDLPVRGELAFWLWRCQGQPPGAAREPVPEILASQVSGEWGAAARGWEALGCPYEQAVALLETGEESGMRSALDIFDRLGARPLAAEARRRLRARGIRRIPRGAHPRTRQNPHGLTDREIRVLCLVAQGCRNAEIARRLFLAEKTVGHHVSSVLAKLDVRSRGAAAAVANELGLCLVGSRPDGLPRGNGRPP